MWEIRRKNKVKIRVRRVKRAVGVVIEFISGLPPSRGMTHGTPVPIICRLGCSTTKSVRQLNISLSESSCTDNMREMFLLWSCQVQYDTTPGSAQRKNERHGRLYIVSMILTNPQDFIFSRDCDAEENPGE